MADNADELEEELDDPISLMDIEDMKTDTCVKDEMLSAVIDVEESTDDESTYTSSYGKREFVLPVTFFDISRNVRLLNKCKPMSIKIVDCKQHPSYYIQATQKKDKNEPDDIVKENGNSASDSASDSKSNNPDNTVIDAGKIIDKVVHKQYRYKKRGDAFYEKLLRRKERKKEIALKSINFRQIDLKRNKGLIGLRITGDIFKQIVETEKALIKTKSHSGETNAKEKNGCQTTKAKSAEDTTTKSAFANPLVKTKSKSVEDKPKEKNESDAVSIKPKNYPTEDKNKEKNNSKSNIEKELCGTKTDFVDKTAKEKRKTDAGNILVKAKDNIPKNKAKENSETGTDNVLAKTKSIPVESKYINEFGVVLDCLGTSVIPIVNTEMHVPKTVSLNNDKVHTTDKAHNGLPHGKDKQENNENSRIQCRFQIVKGKIIEKTLKYKKAESNNKTSKNATPKKAIKEIPTAPSPRNDKKVPTLSLKRSNDDTDNFYVTSEISKIQCKSAKNIDVGKSTETKQDNEANINEDTNITKKYEGSNSPVIPCTTRNVSRASIPPNVPAKDSSTPNQTSTRTINIDENEISKKNPLATRLFGVKNNGPAQNTASVFENRLSDQNLSKTNVTVCNTSKPQIKPPSALNTSLATDPAINGLKHSNQANPNLSKNLPAFFRPRYCGNNAIILRMPPPTFQTNMQGGKVHARQTVINNRFQNQCMPMAARPTRYSYNINYPQHRPMNQYQFPHVRMPSAMAIRGYGPRSPGYRLSPPPPPPPGPPPQGNLSFKTNPNPPSTTIQVCQDSIIGSTKTGEPIKKINIVARPANAVTDKEMMLAELNNAMMSPDITENNPEDKISKDLKHNVDPRSSKPCPLSKKNNNVDVNTAKFPEKSPTQVGYSPPILPILTYQETIEILSQDGQHTAKPGPTCDVRNQAMKLNTPYSGLNIKKLDDRAQKRKIPHEESVQDKAKKISFEDYKKRVTKDDRFDVNKIRKYNESKNPTDDYNQDQGYDSDSTVKL